MTHYETGPNTRTRRYWIAATIGITAMVVFSLLAIFFLIGVIVGPDSIKAIADRAFPWSLLALAVAGVAMFVANLDKKEDSDSEEIEAA